MKKNFRLPKLIVVVVKITLGALSPGLIKASKKTLAARSFVVAVNTQSG